MEPDRSLVDALWRANVTVLKIIESEQEHATHTAAHLDRIIGEAPLPGYAAALFHDIDRSVPPSVDTRASDPHVYLEQKRRHAERSAKLAGQALETLPEPFVEDVQYLIEHHEHGSPEYGHLSDAYTGTYDLNGLSRAVSHADKLAFFTQSIEDYYERNGAERLEMKIRFSVETLPEERVRDVLGFAYSEPLRGIVQNTLKEHRAR